MTENAAVVVGVDGSEGSGAALRWAAQEAHRRQLPLPRARRV
jgi:nucleotide-binding universal stress UspA family protein